MKELPRIPLLFFRWYCHPDYREDIEGDLRERFDKTIEEKGIRAANWGFFKDVMKLFRPGIIRSLEGSYQLNQYGMLKNYFKTAFRNLQKNKMFSLINVMGLAIGMTAFLIISGYVRFEIGYDSFHKNANNIYRVTMDRYVDNEFKFKSAKTYPAIAPRLINDFPGILEHVRLLPDHGILAEEDTGQRYYEDKLFFADASFFQVFSFKLIKGDAKNILLAPNTIALSASTAIKYFGNTEAVGKILNFYKDDGTHEIYKVTGIFEDVPPNSHLQFDILMSYSTLQKRYKSNNPGWKPSEDSWEVDEYYTYVLLDGNLRHTSLEEMLPAFFIRYKGELFNARNVREVLHLQPLLDIHLYSDLQSEIAITGNFRFVYYLIITAIFTMIIAWINYINLTTAKATERAREVGIRKAMGSQRSQLVSQFVVESILVNVLALGITLTFYYLLSPFLQVLPVPIMPVPIFDSMVSFGLILSLSPVGIALSSFYPALVLSGFKPIAALKGKITPRKHGINLRQGLVIFQFATAILMISGLLTIHKQINFMKTQDLGFDTEKLVIVKAASYLKNSSEKAYETKAVTFKEQLLQHPQVINITESGFIPGQEIAWRQGLVRRAVSDSSAINTYHVFAVDERFFVTYNMKVITGRVFSETFTPDDGVIINEDAAYRLGFARVEDAIGEEIYIELDGKNKGQIIAVVNNYHHLSLKNDFQPQIFFYRAATWSYFTVKVAGKSLPEEINTIRKEFASAFPDNPFDYFFLDHYFDAQYIADQWFGKILGFFSLLAIIIATFGLFALSSYTTIQRTKEIGIRKVLGASVENIVTLLFKDFIKLMLIAGTLALPLTYWVIHQWLENYAFHIKITIWLLVTPVTFVLVLALAATGVQTIRAALRNPINSLRSE